MSTLHTFYVKPEDFGRSMNITGRELHHLSEVLRLKMGDRIRALDGQGHIADAIIEAINRHEAKLSAEFIRTIPRPSSLPIIALALSKAVRRGFFLEKAVELGAHEIWLWQGEHSQGKLPPNEKDSLQLKMIAGIKQSVNPWLPGVRTFPQGISDVITAGHAAEHHFLPWEVQKGIPMLTLNDCGLAGTTVYVIGPEGGFSTAELSALRTANYIPVSLGSRILRCETAATLCLGLHWWASQQKEHSDCSQS